jgi:hypothetical protein
VISDSGKRFEGTTNPFFEENLGNFVREAFNKRDDSSGRRHTLGGDRSRDGVKILSKMKSFRYLLVRIPIQPKDLTQVGQLLVNVVIITNAKGLEGKGFKYSSFLVRVMVGGRVKI